MTESEQPPTGVLASLPSTRPQRRSPKRSPVPTAATPATPRRARTRSTSQVKQAKAPARPSARGAAPPPPAPPPPAPPPPSLVPLPALPPLPAPAAQGFHAARGAVDPPSRTALLGSVVTGAGEIAGIGLAAGRHVLRSIYGRIPHP